MTPEERLQRMIEAARETGTGGDAWQDFAGRAHRALFLRRAAMVTAAVALVVVGAFSAAALVRDGSSVPPPVGPAEGPSRTPETTSTPTPAVSRSTAESPPPPAATIEPFPAEVWLVQEDGRLFWGWTNVPLTNEPRSLSSGLSPGSTEQRLAVVIEALLESPTSPDIEAGASTAIPKGTRVTDVAIEDGVATVALSREFESGGGSLSMQLRVAQVVYQATQVDGVDGVRIAIDGEVVDTIGGEGLVVDHPMDRTEFDEVSPPIVMIMPKINSTVSGSVLVTGRANVFEANVSIRVIGEDGELLKETFTTATCGSGCWGEFSKRVRFSVDHEQEGRVEVLSYSAEDGSPQDVISVPVILTP